MCEENGGLVLILRSYWWYQVAFWSSRIWHLFLTHKWTCNAEPWAAQRGLLVNRNVPAGLRGQISRCGWGRWEETTFVFNKRGGRQTWLALTLSRTLTVDQICDVTRWAHCQLRPKKTEHTSGLVAAHDASSVRLTTIDIDQFTLMKVPDFKQVKFGFTYFWYWYWYCTGTCWFSSPWMGRCL